jgi:uncharacterized membrane protein
MAPADHPSPALPAQAAVAPDPYVQRARALALAALVALIANGLLWELWLAPIGRGTLAIKVLPLVLCLVGLLRHRLYTFRWLALLVWLYFLEGVVRGVTERGVSQLMALMEVALSVLLFAACGLYVRRRLRNGRLASSAPAASAGS